MSVHIVDGFTVRETLVLQNYGSLTSRNVDLSIASDADKHLNLSTNGIGNLKVSNGTLSKTVFMGQKSLSVTGASFGTVDLFSIMLKENVFGGLKLYVTVRDEISKDTRFDEFISNIQYRVQPAFYQLASCSGTSAGLGNNTRSCLSATTSVTQTGAFIVPITYHLNNLTRLNGNGMSADFTIAFFAEWFGDVETTML